jgi:hypothetical protein
MDIQLTWHMTENKLHRLECICARIPTYEKSDPACDSRVALLRGVQAALIIPSKCLCFSPDLFLHFFLVGLNAAITYSRAWRIQGAAPKVAHSHTRPISVMWFSGLPTTRNTHTLELRTFHPFTHKITQTIVRILTLAPAYITEIDVNESHYVRKWIEKAKSISSTY